MAKSPLAKGSNKAKPVRNSKNVVPLYLTIPHQTSTSNDIQMFDVSHLLYLNLDKNNDKVESRETYLRSFCNKSKRYVDIGNSAKTVTSVYDSFNQYIKFCDSVDINPFSEAGYLKYAGNDGELRHRIKSYNPSKKLWERQHGEELGIKESSACTILSQIRIALSWCDLPVALWHTQHRGFSGENTPFKGYSDIEEKLLVTRLSELFFTLAPQLIAAKETNLVLPDELPVTIDLGRYQEVFFITTSLKSNLASPNKKGSLVKASAAFNMVMGAAYHLMCFFTSLNDSNIRDIGHPIKIHIDERDKSLQVVKVSSFKVRANKKVDAVLTNESFNKFDVDKRDGVKFIKVLETLSRLYGDGKESSRLIFTLTAKGEASDYFNLPKLNNELMVKLNLLSPTRASILPWFKKLFYNFRNQCIIKLNTVVNRHGRKMVNKVVSPCNKSKSTLGATNAAYCILSCYTDLPLKGILLPLSYSNKDSDGNINVSFKYRNGDNHCFSIPAADKNLIQDIEQHATELADKQTVKKDIRLLLKRGGNKARPKDWTGISPISSNTITQWSIGTNSYFISLLSSNWRETTSNQVYSDSGINGVQSVLQNLLETIDKHYANGDPKLNKIIISQAIQVIERLYEDKSLEQAKEVVAAKLSIPMLAHDEWQKKKDKENAKTNPNGINCNRQQSITGGRNNQSTINKAMSLKLSCAEYDMCYKCHSAKAVDDVQSIYKLISFIDVLKETLDQYPNVKDKVHEKIAAFEFTLDGASNNVYERAMELFNKNGRHPRVSKDHANLALYN
jgi:hypothetical protein